jgi:hypothetical protein
MSTSDHAIRELSIPLSYEISEYLIIREDIETSIKSIRLWFDKYPFSSSKDGDRKLISQSLFRDSIVMFVGCFDKNAKVALASSEVYSMHDGSLQYFHWLKDIRDAYAAHKFGPLRQLTAGVVIDRQGSFIKISYDWYFYAGPKRSQRDQMIQLMLKAGQFVQDRINKLGVQLEDYAKRLSNEERLKLSEPLFHSPNANEIRTSRARFRTIISDEQFQSLPDVRSPRHHRGSGRDPKKR